VHHTFRQTLTETQKTLVGGGKRKKAHWIYKDLQKYQINNTVFSEGTTFKFLCHCSNNGLLPDYIGQWLQRITCLLAIPITQLHSISKPELIEICRKHNIPVKKRDPMEIIEGHLRRHRPCPTCHRHYTLFVENDCKTKTSAERIATFRSNQSTDSPEVHCDLSSSSKQFPPSPPSGKLMEHMVNSYCVDLEPQVIVEEGCAVCGVLYRSKDMNELQEHEYDMELLKSDSIYITRQMQLSVQDDIKPCKGPILASGCDKVCKSCAHSLSIGRTPK